MATVASLSEQFIAAVRHAQASGIPLWELARWGGIDRSVLSLWLLGARGVTPGHPGATRLGIALGLQPEDLFVIQERHR